MYNAKHDRYYESACGRFYIWKEHRHGHEDVWYLNSHACDKEADETIVLGGFLYKYLAVEYLNAHYDKLITNGY